MIPALVADCAPSARYTADKPAAEQVQPPAPSRAVAPRQLERAVNSYLGTPYRFGGSDRRGFDCSGFVQTIYREVYGRTLPRTSSRMFEAARPVTLNAARPGDLVFFRNNFGPIDHVGIYMGGGKFAHSSNANGVIYSSLNEPYYSRRFAGIRRVL